MSIENLMKKEIPQISDEIKNALSKNEITPTLFNEKNTILMSESLQQEVGYKRMDDGSYIVSMYCPMPNITPEMIKWWFWWHPQEDIRYQVWYPDAHVSIGYDKRQADYFKREVCPEFQNNSQYPVEIIGEKKMPLRIDFVTPKEFGFSEDVMEENGIPLIMCGHVGAFKGMIWHTEMAHIFKNTEDGLFMISRFWIGETLKNPILRKTILTDDTAKGMAEHCCVEYRNLLEILPILYGEYHNQQKYM